MLMRSYADGARAAAERFGVREASALQSVLHYLPELLSTAAAGKVVGALKNVGQDVARVAAPRAYAAAVRPLARASELAGTPERLLRQHVVPAALQRSPEEALLRALSGAPGSSRWLHMPPSAIHGRPT